MAPIPVVNASYSFELLRRLTSVAQSTTCRSMLNPTSSSCCFVRRAKSYIHLYSWVVTNRMGSPLYPAFLKQLLRLVLLCSFQPQLGCGFTYQGVFSTKARLASMR